MPSNTELNCGFVLTCRIDHSYEIVSIVSSLSKVPLTVESRNILSTIVVHIDGEKTNVFSLSSRSHVLSVLRGKVIGKTFQGIYSVKCCISVKLQSLYCVPRIKVIAVFRVCAIRLGLVCFKHYTKMD